MNPTRESIEQMEAGPEMDKLVLIDVMKWECVYIHPHSIFFTVPGVIDHWLDTNGERQPSGFSPSTNIAAAWQVAEKMREKYRCDVSVTLRGDLFGREKAQYCKIQGGTLKYDNPSIMLVCKADTAALAICRASVLITLSQ